MQTEQILFLIILICSVSVAFVMGERDERIAGVSTLFAAIISPVVQGSHFTKPDYGLLFVDLSLFTILLLIALRSDRFWPLFASGFLLSGTIIHFFPGLLVSVAPDSYADMASLWAYPVQVSLLLGTALESSRRERIE